MRQLYCSLTQPLNQFNIFCCRGDKKDGLTDKFDFGDKLDFGNKLGQGNDADDDATLRDGGNLLGKGALDINGM